MMNLFTVVFVQAELQRRQGTDGTGQAHQAPGRSQSRIVSLCLVERASDHRLAIGQLGRGGWVSEQVAFGHSYAADLE